MKANLLELTFWGGRVWYAVQAPVNILKTAMVL